MPSVLEATSAQCLVNKMEFRAHQDVKEREQVIEAKREGLQYRSTDQITI
jgi:hypothetical protein